MGVRSSASVSIVFFDPLPRLAGVMDMRYLLLGAKTPWNRVRLTLGLGTRAARLQIPDTHYFRAPPLALNARRGIARRMAIAVPSSISSIWA